MDFAKIKDGINAFADIIKDFTQMIANFVASWKKVPNAAAED